MKVLKPEIVILFDLFLRFVEVTLEQLSLESCCIQKIEIWGSWSSSGVVLTGSDFRRVKWNPADSQAMRCIL